VKPFEFIGVKPFEFIGVKPFKFIGVKPFEFIGVKPFEFIGVKPFANGLSRSSHFAKAKRACGMLLAAPSEDAPVS
jgi:hypothetical protein